MLFKTSLIKERKKSKNKFSCSYTRCYSCNFIYNTQLSFLGIEMTDFIWQTFRGNSLIIQFVSLPSNKSYTPFIDKSNGLSLLRKFSLYSGALRLEHEVWKSQGVNISISYIRLRAKTTYLSSYSLIYKLCIQYRLALLAGVIITKFVMSLTTIAE